MEQAVAHVQLHRGEVAVAAEMAFRFVFFQQLADAPIRAVPLSQRQIFARVVGQRAVHAGQKTNAYRSQQDHHAQSEAQRDQRGLVKTAKAAGKGQPPPEKRRDLAKTAQQQDRQQKAGGQRRNTDIDQLGRVGPETGQRQHPQVFQQRRRCRAGQKAGQTASLGKPAPGDKQRSQRRCLHKDGKQEKVSPAVAQIQPCHLLFLPALASRSISRMK